MLQLSELRFAEWFRAQPETGMGYWVVSAHLRNGRVIPQVMVDSGYVTRVRGYGTIPFAEGQVDHFEITHDKWDWRGDR